uniref:DUF1985 domain-containing protein n=1 Tax=Lactuca sativa TaxID=4236 RepID=A0A9R1WDX2_LACSA|nr:hypothetical protein LSAT_V11C200071330 [Lactuca sativa]
MTQIPFSHLVLFQHNHKNVKVVVKLKGSGCNIWETFEQLNVARREAFRRTVFGFLLDVHSLQGDRLLFHKMFLHQIHADTVLSLDDIQRSYFKVGDTQMVYGCEEFCLITGFNFGVYPKQIGKKSVFIAGTSLFEQKYSLVTISDLKSFLLNNPFLVANDNDAVRACLIYVLCEWFLGKEISDRLQDYLFFFFFVQNLDDWNILHEFSSTRCQGVSICERCLCVALKQRYISEEALECDVTKGHRPRHKMIPSDEETRKSYYLSCLEYVCGEPASVPSHVRKHFRRQQESSSSLSSSGRSEARARRSGKPSIEDLTSQVIALEEMVFLNRKRTELKMDEVNEDNLWEHIDFDEPVTFQTNHCFDDGLNKQVSVDNDEEQVLMYVLDEGENFENEGRTTNHFNEAVLDDNEATPPGSPRIQNPSKYFCSPYTQVYNSS